MSSPPVSLTALATPVILGSSSKWRAGVIREMGVPLARQMNPDIDEYVVRPPGQSLEEDRNLSKPDELSLAVARAKAHHLLKEFKEDQSAHLLITSDQVAFFDGRIREKPQDQEQCRTWFNQYAERAISVCNAVVVTNTRTRREYSGTATASQLFLPVPSEVLDGVIATGDILSCCGGFLVDDPRILPYLSTRVGTEDELVGMPKRLVADLLQQADADAQA